MTYKPPRHPERRALRALRSLAIPTAVALPMAVLPAAFSVLVGTTGCFEITNPNPEVDAGGPIGAAISGQIYTRSGATAPTEHLRAVRAGLAMAKKRAGDDRAEAQAEENVSPGLSAPAPRSAKDLARDNLLRDQIAIDLVDKWNKSGTELRWMSGQAVVLMEKGSIARDRVGDHVRALIASKGLEERVAASVKSCTASLFCLVELTDAAGKPLDLLETERVTGELEEERIAAQARGEKTFQSIARNFLKHSVATPNDEYYVFQWHYTAANIPTAWDYTVGSPDLIVAVIDSGLRTDHVDITGRYVQGADLIIDPNLALDGDGRDTDARDPGDLQFGEVSSWHGTHVAGTIAATTNNQSGVSGILWQGNVMPVRVLGLQGNGTDFDILSALFYAVGDPEVEGVPVTQTPAKILNVSIGGPSTPEAQQAWIEAIAELTGPNASNYGNPIIVVAAGNEGQDVVNSTPANVPGVIAVGAHNYLGQRAPYSNYGQLITVMAPGGDTERDDNQDELPDGVLSLFETQYNFIHGTSMATPHVSGIVGLLLSIQPELTQSEVRQALRSFANPAGQCSEGCGAGYVDAAALVVGSGAQPDEQPRLTTESATLVFQPGEITRQVVIRNTGGAALEWSGQISGAQGALFALQTQSGSIPAGGTQQVTIQLNRGDFEAGSANFIIDGQGAAQGQAARVDLSFADIPPPPKVNLQRVEVRLYRVNADNTLTETNNVFIARAPDFEYSFDDLEPGGYQIFAVGDDNNDTIFDPQRESVGGWPLADGVETFTVEPQTQYTNVSFGLIGGFVIGAVGDVGAPCLGESDCDFGEGADCIVDWPGGYCSRDCTLDGRCNGASCEGFDDCGNGAPCGLCLVTCATASQCRQNEGYICDDFGTCSPPGI